MGAANHSISTEKLYVGSICFHLLLLLVCSTIVASQSIVRYLPGFTGPLPFELETGYIGLDDSDDVQLFYYFIKSERNPSEDPLMLWLTGGPGCSALTGLAFEIGPLYFKKIEYNGSLPTLELNPNSWTKASNIIFLDQPLATGFSYPRNFQGSNTSDDTKSAKQTYTFIRRWLVKHPEFLANPFYVAGDSWSGFTIPIVAQHISDGIEAGHKPPINLKGYLLGNPGTDKALETNSKIPFLHGMGIISDELYELAKKSCKGDYANVHPSNAQCNKDLQAVLELTSRINQPHILEPFNLLLVPKSQQITKERRALHENSSKLIISMPKVPDFRLGPMVIISPTIGQTMKTSKWHLTSKSSYYGDQLKNVNCNDQGTVGEWIRCNWDLPITKDVQNSVDYHRLLSKRNYRSLIYSGDHDLMVPFISTQAWIRSLNYSIIDEWRPWFVNGQVAGYTRTYSNNMTFATVKGGGHTAPEYRPEECLAMFTRCLSCDHL